MSEIAVQKINKVYKDKIECSIAYYSFISALYNLSLTTSEIQLLAFTNIRGTISSITAKQEFIKQYDVSMGTITNMISKLYKKKLLVKVNSVIKVHPKLSMVFDKDLVINLIIKNAENSK